jgi:hypothetical protein
MGFIIPHERWILRSPLSTSDALARLADQVGPPRVRLPWNRCETPFEGYVRGRQFNIRRSNQGRGAGLPTIVGQAFDDPGGSRFEIAFRVRMDLIAFLVIGILFCCSTALHDIGALLGGLFLVVAWEFMVRLSFSPEMKKAKVELAKALGAPRPPTPPGPPSPTSWLEPEDE